MGDGASGLLKVVSERFLSSLYGAPMLPLNNNSFSFILGSLWRSNIAERHHNWEYYVLTENIMICRTRRCADWSILNANRYKLTMSSPRIGPIELLVFYYYPESKAHILLIPLPINRSYFYDKETGLAVPRQE